MNIIGRLTRDAEVHTVSQDKKVVNFSVATNDSYRNKAGERVEQTTYFDCAYWISENVAKALLKGTLVELSGRVSARSWIGSDGQAHAGLNFRASEIKFHGGAKKSQGSETGASTKAEKSGKAETAKEGKSEGNQSEETKVDDDLPF